MYFGDRPSIPVYEIRHTIPCHEDIWWAETSEEWAERRRTMAVNEAEFPLLMSMLISPDIPMPPANLSILGGFGLLHGTPLTQSKSLTTRSAHTHLDPTAIRGIHWRKPEYSPNRLSQTQRRSPNGTSKMERRLGSNADVLSFFPSTSIRTIRACILVPRKIFQ